MPENQQAIEEMIERMEDAWNRYDSQSFAALFSEDATFIQIYGGQLDGRALIEASHRAIFSTIYKGSRARFTLRSARFVRPDVALVFAFAHLAFTEGGEPREIETRPTMVAVFQNARWEIVAFQNTRISPMPAAAQTAAGLAR